MKTTKQYFSVVLFIMLFKMVLTCKFGDEIMKCHVTIQMKATKQYFLVALFSRFIMLYKVILTFESMNEALKCESN